jgi:hypothetical protein
MTIETKFNYGDTVFVLTNNKVYNVTIIGVNVQYGTEIDRVNQQGRKSCSNPKQYITYKIEYQSGGETTIDEDNVFATKDELLKSL